MISISKTQFAVLGFVFVAVLLIPVNDAFGDTTFPVVTVPADMNYNTIDSSGRSISFQEGWVHPFGTEIKVTDDVGIAGVDGYLTCYNSPTVSRSFDNGLNLMYDQIFPVGTTTVTCQGTDTSSNKTFESFDVTINYTPLTINSLEIYEDGSQMRYRVIGDAPPFTNLTFEASSPSGSIDYPGSAGTGNPAYDMDNLVGSTSSLESGTWNLKICAPEYAPYSVVDYASISGVGPYVISGYSHCVEETFTLSISEDVTPSLTITDIDQYNCDYFGDQCSGTDHYRIDVDGITTGFAPSQPLTFKITDSNGNTVNDWQYLQATADTGEVFGYEGPVFYDGTFTEQYNGSFTVTICAPEFDVCDEESFTINSIEEAPLSNVDLVPLIEYVNPYPDGSATISPGISGFFAHPLMTNTGTGIAQNADAHLLVVDSNGDVFFDSNVINNIAIGPGSQQSAGLIRQLDANEPLGTWTATFTVDPNNEISETNENNNVHTLTFEVVEFIDLTIPTVNVPDDITLSAPSTYPDWYPQNTRIIEASEFTGNYPPTGTDALDGIIDSSNVICTEPNSGFVSGNLPGADGGLKLHFWPVGVNTVTCEATNSAGKTGSASFTITITEASEDTTPPVISLGSLAGNTDMTNVMMWVLNNDMHNEITVTDNVGIEMNPGNPSFFQVPDVSATHSPQIGTWCDNGQYWQSGLSLPFGTTTITCKAWDTSGNEGTASFTVTVDAPEDTTPTSDPSFTTIIQHFPDGIDGPGSAPMTCVQYENLPAGVEYTALLGPHRYSSFEGANSVFYYDENFQWVSWLSHIDSSDPRFSATGTSNLDFRFCSNGLESGDYKLVAFADGIGNPNDPNVPNMDDLIEFATPVTVADASADTTPPVLSTDKESYIDTETIIVSGFSADIKRVQITKSDGSNIFDAWAESNTSVYTNNNGNYEYKIIIPNFSSHVTYTGDYIINIKTGGDKNILASKTIHISIVDTPPVIDDNNGDNNIIQLTIDSFEVFEDGSQIRYRVLGETGNSDGTELISSITKPGGTPEVTFGRYVAEPTYDIDDPIDSTDNLVYGNWIVEVCAPEHNICVQESFTVTGSADITPPVIHVPNNITNSTANFDTDWSWLYSGYSNGVDGMFQSFVLTTSDDVDVMPDKYYISGYSNLMQNMEPLLVDCTTSANISDQLAGLQGYNYDRQGYEYGFWFPIGTTTVNCSTFDTAGNEGFGSFTVTIVETDAETSIPVLTLESGFTPVTSMTNSTTNPDGMLQSFQIRVADNGNNNLHYDTTCSVGQGAHTDYWNFWHTFPIGTTTVQCSATDAAGNTGTISFPVTIVDSSISADTTPPVIITDSDIKLSTTNSTGLVVTYSPPRATDDFGVTIQPTCTPKSDTLFPIGLTSVVCTASDGAGNVGTNSFIVNVINTKAVGDNQPPSFTKKQSITVDATSSSNGATVKYELPKVTDNVAIESGPTCTPASGSFFPIGPTTVKCTAFDAAGNQGSTTFVITVKSLIVAPIEIPTNVSISIGKSEYNSKEAIYVKGEATPFTENSVSINVKDQLNQLVSAEQTSPNSYGQYTAIILPSSLWMSSGNYTVSAMYGTSVDDVSFEFEFIETEIDNSNIPTGINLQVDSSGILIGDTISLKSQLIDGTSGQSIQITVQDPSGNIVLLESLNTDDSGSVSSSFKALDTWKPGKYTISASDNSPLWDYSTSEIIQILRPLPEIIISPTLTTTESGDEIETYKAGDIGYFSTSLLSESTSNVLVTINVVDAEDTTLGVAFFKSIIGKGDSKIVLGFKIPEDAANGLAKIYVNTYTDWPDKGGRPISSELLSEVNIEGMIIEEITINDEIKQNSTETNLDEIESNEPRILPTLPENIIPKLSFMSDITEIANSGSGNIISYSLPTATGGEITSTPTCTPKPNSLFSIGSTQVTCTAKNKVGNMGMTSFMVTVNPDIQITNQTLSVKVGKSSYTNLEPIFITGSVGTITGEYLTLFVNDNLDNLVSIEQITPKTSGVYNVVLSSNSLWADSGSYFITATYGNVNAIDSFNFELIPQELVLSTSTPTSLNVSTDDSAYVLGLPVQINLELIGAEAGESILVEILDPQNKPVFLRSLFTNGSGMADVVYQLESSQEGGTYSINTSSPDWNFKNSASFDTIAQIPDMSIGDVSSTNQNGTNVNSFEVGDMGYFQTPIISNSVSNVLITVDISDSENIPLGLAYFDSQIMADSFDIVLGLQIPENASPGMATVYVNTYTDWPDKGGVSILKQQLSYIDIQPSTTTNLIVSTNSTGGVE